MASAKSNSSSNMTLKTKLYILAGVPCIGILILCAIALRSFDAVKVNGDYYKHIVLGKDLIADILPPPEYVIESYFVALQMLNENDPKELTAFAERIKVLKGDYDTRHKYWIDSSLEEGELRDALLKGSYDPAIKFYEILDAEFIPAIQSGDKAKAVRVATTNLKEQYTAHREVIDKAVGLANKLTADFEGEAAKAVEFLYGTLLGLSGAILLAAIGVAYSVNRSVVRSLTSATSDICKSGSEVNSASVDLTTSSQTLSEGATESAASLEESVASLEELSSMVKQNALNAIEAANLTQSGKQAAEHGEAEIQKLISSMNNIAKSSKKIEDIITVIDDIAFQTNLLALNAAVEAARAGDQGKGFAVVAEAVRSLAQRSASAAKEITVLIKESVSQVENGSQIADTSGAVLGTILDSIKKIAVLNQEIASATKEQETGLEQINIAMQQLEQSTQRNASSAEQVAGSAIKMSEQSESLDKLVGDLVEVIHGSRDKIG